RRRRMKNIKVLRSSAAAKWKWLKAVAAAVACCANFPILPPRSPAIARTNISAPSHCGSPIRIATSSSSRVMTARQPASPSPPPAASKKGYWIVQVDVPDADAYKPYLVANQAPFGQFGARYLVRGGRRDVMEGSACGRIVVLEFPSFEAALAC